MAVASVAFATSALAETLFSSWPTPGDAVPVTLTLRDVPGGNAVEITVAIPPGEGELLGLFGNVTDESLVPQLDAVGSLVTQEQYAANDLLPNFGPLGVSPLPGFSAL